MNAVTVLSASPAPRRQGWGARWRRFVRRLGRLGRDMVSPETGFAVAASMLLALAVHSAVTGVAAAGSVDPEVAERSAEVASESATHALALQPARPF